MKKSFPALLLALALLLATPVQATQEIPRQRTYAGEFSDLSAGSSFYDNVAALYEYGLSNGKTDGSFGLRDSLTVGQVVIFAGRVRSLCLTGDPESGPNSYRAAGDDVALIYPSSGTSCVPDASALIQGAPHPENARRFLDFTVSYEVQRLLAEQFCRRSVRKDLPSALMPLEDIALVDYDVEEASAGRDAVLMTWAFYLGGEEAP